MIGPRRRPAPPAAILGIDFSGAADAGRKIWIAQARAAGGRLRLAACDSACALLGCDAAPAASHAALVRYLAARGPCVVGCDMPFSLPAAMIPERTWPAFLTAYGRRYASADAFYRATQRRWGEPHRQCDREARTPFAPNNLRLYRQTDGALRNVLAPLVRSRAACAVPLQAPRAGVPWLLECCPASALKRLGLYRPYKGAGVGLARRRGRILGHLERHGGLQLAAPALRARIVAQAGGDALDSVVAAWIAWQSLRAPGGLARRRGWPAIEGFVYC